MRAPSRAQFAVIKAALFILLALPAAIAAVRVLMGEVAEPADYLTHISGGAIFAPAARHPAGHAAD